VDLLANPITRRATAFARREGCGGIIVANLFALRATDPIELTRAADPFGPKNADALLAILQESTTYGTPVVCAWGTKGGKGVARFVALAKGTEARLVCLGQTKDSHPRHPLYVRGDQPLTPWSPLK
jgi:hypothetical protein